MWFKYTMILINPGGNNLRKTSITAEEISSIFRNALKSGKIIRNDDTSIIFYSLSFLQERINELKKVFPQNSLHAIAIKANPLLANLKFIKKLNVGAEAASLPEVYLALKAAFKNDKIVFDSPAKTKEEIAFALKNGININADSLEELELIKKFLIDIKSKSRIGIRINPQVGIGKIPETSVAGEYSKFGVPIKEKREELQKFIFENDWLRSVHLHIGSQGISLQMLLRGNKTVYDFVIHTNKLLIKKSKKPIDRFDIGGGLPVSYYSNRKSISLKEYYSGLKKSCPDLFSNRFKLVTEFGRFIYANSAWAVSRIEYVKRSKTKNTAIIHLGADMFLRKVYMPGKWHHDIFALNRNGIIKRSSRKKKYVIAGPLCFSGDVLEKDISLPELRAGDFIVIKDVGAYTMSMWSRYNSRQLSKVIGYLSDGKSFSILKDRENLNSVIEFWS
jgi:diaminopimelate decarboxylase